MSLNKKALTRYLAYDKLLRDKGRKFTWRELVEAANRALKEDGSEGIGKTQFYADMNYMRSSVWKAPIETEQDPSDKRIRYFFYEDKGYSISNQPLSETESKQLKAAISVLSRFTGLPQFEWVREIIQAIETTLGVVKTEKPVMAFEANIDYEGLTHITPLFNAIVNRRVVVVTYQDFKSAAPYAVELHPYFLKQYNSRWFIFGHNTDKNTIQNLALDRIKGIRECQTAYRSCELDWEYYFDDFVGVSRKEGEPVEIRIRVLDAEQAAYIRTKPLHQSQKPIRAVDNGFETSIKVIPNYELEKLIMSFGDRIVILSPDHFRKKIGAQMKKAASFY